MTRKQLIAACMVADFKTTASYKTLCEVFTEARQAAKGLEV